MSIAANFLSRTGYRIPTEAEWEYACRAGTVTSRCFGDSDELMVKYACCLLNLPEGPLPAGSLMPNAFGLFDMHGNVFEWCLDGYEHEGGAATNDEETVSDTAERLVRSGAFYTRASHVRSASRYKDSPALRNDGGGFRLARSRPRGNGH